jgi:hypothetical protein
MSGLTRDQTIELLKTGKYSDFTIKCGDKSFAVHKNIVAAQSKFFRSAIDDGFKESLEHEITIEEASPLAVAMVVVYLYFFQSAEKIDPEEIYEAYYETLHDKFTSEEYAATTPFEDSVDIYLLADRLMLSGLRTAMDKDIGYDLVTAWDRAVAGYTNEKELWHQIEQVYKSVPSSDDMLRPYLTAWIISGIEISRSRLDSQGNIDFDKNYGILLDLAKTYDLEGVLVSRIWLQKLQDTEQVASCWKSTGQGVPSWR